MRCRRARSAPPGRARAENRLEVRHPYGSRRARGRRERPIARELVISLSAPFRRALSRTFAKCPKRTRNKATMLTRLSEGGTFGAARRSFGIQWTVVV